MVEFHTLQYFSMETMARLLVGFVFTPQLRMKES